MKMTCDRQVLLSAFQTAAMVAPTRSPRNILQNVKIQVHDNQGVLIATDMEIGICLTVQDLNVETPGVAVLPVASFGSILRESREEQLTLEVVGEGVRVRGAYSQFELPTQNPDEFPAVATFEEEKYHKLPARLLRELIRRTLFATDLESSRYALGGVLLELTADGIIAVGTDGRRLAKMEGVAESVGGHESGGTTTIVPARSMQLIERALTDLDAEVCLAARSNDVILKTATATIHTRLVEGRFPKWRDVFPTRTDAQQIDLQVGPLYSALRQASIVSDEDSRGIDFSFGDGKLVLAASSADVGQSRIEVPIAYEGPAITVTLNHRFVSDFLRVLEAEKNVTVEIEDDEAATLFSTDDGYRYVVMPLARDR